MFIQKSSSIFYIRPRLWQIQTWHISWRGREKNASRVNSSNLSPDLWHWFFCCWFFFSLAFSKNKNKKQKQKQKHTHKKNQKQKQKQTQKKTKQNKINKKKKKKKNQDQCSPHSYWSFAHTLMQSKYIVFKENKSTYIDVTHIWNLGHWALKLLLSNIHPYDKFLSPTKWPANYQS